MKQVYRSCAQHGLRCIPVSQFSQRRSR